MTSRIASRHTAGGPHSGAPLPPLVSAVAAATTAMKELLSASSIPQIRRMIEASPADFARLLSLGVSDPWIVLPAILATRTLGSASLTEGDPTLWFARQCGVSLKEANNLLRCAKWLFRPSAYETGSAWVQRPQSERLAEARRQQDALRAQFQALDSSLWVINTCRDQVGYLCPDAKHLAADLICEVLSDLGPKPNPNALLEALQIAVKAANRSHQPDQGEHSYLKFARARQGMAAIKGFCSAKDADLIRRALVRYADAHGIDRLLPAHKRNFQALRSMCLASAELAQPAAIQPEAAAATAAANRPPAACPQPEPGFTYRVNVAITFAEYEQLLAGKLNTVETDRGELVPWQVIAGRRLNPIDAVTLIGEHGAQLRELSAARFFSPEQRDWQLSFQVRCAHPGCLVPARDCQAHHIVPVSRGGQTTTDNLVLVCQSHHGANDDSHASPGRFHYEKDTAGFPYVVFHAEAASGAGAKREYNTVNITRSAAARARAQAAQAPPAKGRRTIPAPGGTSVGTPVLYRRLRQ